METSCPVRNSSTPSVAHGGMAPCATRRPSVGDRPDTHLWTRGLARDRDEGKEEEWLGPPDQPRSLVKPHMTWSVEVEQLPQRASGMAQAADESPPCPGDDCPNPRGLAREEGGEAVATGHGPVSPPLRHSPQTQAWPDREGDASRTGIVGACGASTPRLEDVPPGAHGVACDALDEDVLDELTNTIPPGGKVLPPALPREGERSPAFPQEGEHSREPPSSSTSPLGPPAGQPPPSPPPSDPGAEMEDSDEALNFSPEEASRNGSDVSRLASPSPSGPRAMSEAESAAEEDGGHLEPGGGGETASRPRAREPNKVKKSQRANRDKVQCVCETGRKRPK